MFCLVTKLFENVFLKATHVLWSIHVLGKDQHLLTHSVWSTHGILFSSSFFLFLSSLIWLNNSLPLFVSKIVSYFVKDEWWCTLFWLSLKCNLPPPRSLPFKMANVQNIIMGLVWKKNISIQLLYSHHIILNQSPSMYCSLLKVTTDQTPQWNLVF